MAMKREPIRQRDHEWQIYAETLRNLSGGEKVTSITTDENFVYGKCMKKIQDGVWRHLGEFKFHKELINGDGASKKD